jgi:UDP-glucose-4-epimerase GalE
MRILVTGGRGYLGTQLVPRLLRKGHDVTIVDSLRRSLDVETAASAEFRRVDIRDASAMAECFAGRAVDTVVHLAAMTFPGESVEQPDECRSINLEGTRILLAAMRTAGVCQLVFASSCAVYGSPKNYPVDEDSPTHPESPYAETKLAAEVEIAEAGNSMPEFGAVILRCFNIVGGNSGASGDRFTAATRLIPAAVRAARDADSPVLIRGIDWPTPDGTSVRDYVHIEDVCRAIELALNAVTPGQVETVNIGSGLGTSLREVLLAVESTVGQTVSTKVGPRGKGEAAAIVADISRAKEFLNWQPKTLWSEDLV